MKCKNCGHHLNRHDLVTRPYNSKKGSKFEMPCRWKNCKCKDFERKENE